MDETKLNEAKTLMRELVLSVAPNVDTRPGTVIGDLVIGLAAIGYATIHEDVSALETQMYLQDIISNPAGADEGVVDGILSNFYISRQVGGKAQGAVKVVVSDYREYLVLKNSEFKAVDGLQFYSINDLNVTLDKLFTEGENYYFFIDIIAEKDGSAYTLQATTAIATSILSGSLISAEAFDDFSGGYDKEGNEAFLQRATSSLGVRALSHRQSISTLLQQEFPDLKQLTAIGYNDREMQRDTNNIGVKVGGKIDIYTRTTSDPNTKTITRMSDANGKILLNDYAAGDVPILRVKYIARSSNPTNISEDFSMAVVMGRPQPYLYRFSRYEVIEVTTPYSNEYMDVTVDYLPLVSDIQDFVDNEEVTYLLAGTLVRTYMPCFVSMIVSYRSDRIGSDVETEDLIRSTVLNFINSYDNDILYVSKLIAELHSIDLVSVEQPLSITGVFHLPDGSTESIVSENSINVDDNIELGVSKKTYRFFATPTDIGVNKINV